jgi:hypothetical protein
LAKKYNFSGYTRVRVRTAVDAEIVRSDTFNIDVETGPLSPVRIRKRRDTLAISRPWYWFVFGFFFKLSRSHVKIAMPEFQELKISDNSSASVAGFSSSNEFRLVLSDSSSFSFSGNLKTGDARLDISGASQAEFNGSSSKLFLKVKDSSSFAGNINVDGNAEIEVSTKSTIALVGSANSMLADISNVSNADMEGFPTHDINIALNSLCTCTIKLDGKLDAEVAGASNLTWSGNPVMGTINVTPSSLLRQK